MFFDNRNKTSFEEWCLHLVLSDKCAADGFYLRDAESFIICSNGNAFVQRCAPGSKSSGVGKLVNGKYYSHSDFCDVNLVDQGYNGHF